MLVDARKTILSKEGQGVLVAPFADHGRRPKSRPHLDHGEDPDWLFLAPYDRFDFVCLEVPPPRVLLFFGRRNDDTRRLLFPASDEPYSTQFP